MPTRQSNMCFGRLSALHVDRYRLHLRYDGQNDAARPQNHQQIT